MATTASPLPSAITKVLTTPLFALSLLSLFCALVLVAILVILVIIYIEYQRLECSRWWVDRIRRVVHPYGGCCCGSCMEDAEVGLGNGTTRWDWNFGVHEKGGVVNAFKGDGKEGRDQGEWRLRGEGETAVL